MKAITHLTYIGHATVLIEMDGARVLTDPLLRDRAGPLRRHRSPIDPAWTQPVDVVLVSHLHWDHFDLPSLRRLGRETRLIVPRGAARFLRRLGFSRVEEIAAGEKTRVGAVDVEATAARHSGFRPPLGPRTACLGYIVHGRQRVYFAGDTDLFPEMVGLGDPLDAALLPVWGWGPTLGAGHLNPRRAAEALMLLRPRVAMPIHWGTLCPVGMGWARPRFLTHPPQAFARHAAQLAPEVEVRITAPGRQIRLSHAASTEAA
jgi:L-ascorbate metabolism protein UlaG (beta-lactamase superfamily)